MIVCSCAAISDADIEKALVEIMSQPGAPLPTPGVVYRHLEKRMVCCGCSPLAVSTIYEKIDELAEKGVVCPYACACAQGRLLKGASETPAMQLIQRAPLRPQRTRAGFRRGTSSDGRRIGVSLRLPRLQIRGPPVRWPLPAFAHCRQGSAVLAA